MDCPRCRQKHSCELCDDWHYCDCGNWWKTRDGHITKQSYVPPELEEDVEIKDE